MKRSLLIFLSVLVFISCNEENKTPTADKKTLESQSAPAPLTVACDSVYEVTEVQAQYKEGSGSLMRYATKEIIPLIPNSKDETSLLPSRLYALLTVNTQGKIVEVEFLKFEASEKCKERVKEKLLSMEGWTPAQLNGQKVCATHPFVISCIKWG